MTTDLSGLFLQGTKPVENLEVGEVTDGFSGRVTITYKELRPRKDMLPLVMLNTEEGEWLRFEPGFPVTYYGPEQKIEMWPGKTLGRAYSPDSL